MKIELYSKTQVDALKLPSPPKNSAAAKILYGNPGTGKKADPKWVQTHLIRMPLPYPMRIAWDKNTVVTSCLVHNYAMDLPHILKDIYLNARVEVKAQWMKNHAKLPTSAEIDVLTMNYLSKYGLDLFGGTYNHRLKRGGSTLSTHAYGCAIDIDPARNGMGNKNFTMPEWVLEIFEAYGWTCGVRWKGRGIDPMHFQRGIF